MRVRDMRPEDLEGVERIYQASSGERDTELFLERARALISRPLGGVALVAQKGSEPIVGYLLGEVRAWEFGSPRSGWLFALGVDPLYQRQGVGRTLLARAQLRFEELGVGRIRTLVHEEQMEFQSLFEGFGFRPAPFVALELSAPGPQPKPEESTR